MNAWHWFTEAPIWLVIVIAAPSGAVVGLLLGRIFRKIWPRKQH